MRRALLVAIALLLLLGASPAAATPAGHYVPRVGDGFNYTESIVVSNGAGSYQGYTEDSVYGGSITVTAVAPNLTASADYASAGTYRNNSGGSYHWSESGSFSFSAVTYRYVQSTDNQSGFLHAPVWFYVNSSLGQGASFTILGTSMTVTSTDVAWAYPSSSTGYVRAFEATGSGAYHRNDSYGSFNAVYRWSTAYDPGTGFVLGYTYVENDSDASGNGFTYTDTLSVVRTTYALESVTVAAPIPWGTILVVVLVVVVLVAVLIALLLRRRTRGGLGRAALPRHPTGAPLGPPAQYGPPPPINLIPRDQPPVAQVVLRETVRVNCRFCGTLIDSTDTVCPKCGAPRT